MCKIYRNKSTGKESRLVREGTLVTVKGVQFTQTAEHLARYYQDTGKVAECHRCSGRECMGKVDP